MKKVLFYHFVLLCLISGGWLLLNTHDVQNYALPIKCILISSLGSVLYCIKSVYHNRCVKNNWDTNWETWYYLRPFTGAICGLVAFIFLKAGLIVLEAEKEAGAGEYGYYAFAFLAGFNVDNFLKKIEEIGAAVFGIERSNLNKKEKE